MDAPELRHRLVAILAADAVGYSRLMSVDDRRTVAALDAARDVFREEIAGAHGRVVDTAGDFVLAIFDAAVNAAAAALAIQRRLALAAHDVPAKEQMQFRIGLHLGDIIEKADASIYGDGVNIAARLQSLAVAGGIVVSQSMHTAVQGRLQTAFHDLGTVTVKNIVQPVRVYQLVEPDAPDRRSWPRRARAWLVSPRGAAILVAASLAIAIPLLWTVLRHASTTAASGAALHPDSIAVLAFANLSGDPNKAYFSDGVSEELANTLGNVPGLAVIARTSTLPFKSKPASAPEVGKLLQVAYVVEGSVRMAGDRARISVRLTRATDGVSIWSDSYDRAIDDVIGVQTEIALIIAQKLRLQIDRARLAASGATNAQAQRLYFEAQQHIYGHSTADYDRAESLLNQAIALDPNYQQAKVRLVNVRWNRLHGQGVLTFKHRDSAEVLGLIATLKDVIAAAPDLPEAHAELGPLYITNWQCEKASEELRRAIEMNPNLATAYLYQAKAFECEGRMTEAIAALERSDALDPLSGPRKFVFAEMLYNAGRWADALVQANAALVLLPRSRLLKWIKAISLSRLGHEHEAQDVFDQMIEGRGDQGLDHPIAWELLARLAGREGRAQIETWLRGPGSESEGPPNPHENRIAALLALQRPADALKDIEDERAFTVDDVVALLLYNPAWDSTSDTPRFREMLQNLQFTDAYQRARAWRTANPPQLH